MLSGEEFVALSQDDMLVRWRPQTPGEFITIAHPAVATPEPDLTPVNMFGGYPLAQSSSGLFIADDQVSPFIGVMSSFTKSAWHRDIFNRLGGPAIQQDVAFMNAGGEDALAGLVAMDTRSGKTLWEYAPQGFPEEPMVIFNRATKREANPIEQRAIAQLRAAQRTRGGPVAKSTSEVFVLKSTSGIGATHGHWFNPGVVVARGRVYGQVEGDILGLAQKDGAEAWKFSLEPGEGAHSIVASKDHLFVSLSKRLVALDLETGKLVWSEATKRGGTLAIANGMVYLTMGSPDGKDEEIIAYSTSE